VGLAACTAVAVLAALGVLVSPPLLLAGIVLAILVAGVAVHPPLGAYVLLVATPLLAGIERGAVVPMVRPAEALIAVVAAGLLARGAARFLAGEARRPRLHEVDAAVVAMALAGSVLPLLWMLARGRQITGDDLQFALQLWKYAVVYTVFHTAVRTEEQVRRCLWLAMAAASAVAVVAILQALRLLGVDALLARWYASSGPEYFWRFRGTSTLASSFAVADVMVFNLAIAVGLLGRGSRHRRALVALAVLFLFGVVASGQFSGGIALLVTMGGLALPDRRVRRRMLALLPFVLLAGLLLWPVIERRLSGFGSLGGLPQSWAVRLLNLRSYFWPELLTDYHWLLGVRPAARVRTVISWPDYTWIESGHTWLLWTGGVPLLLAFLVFLWVAIRRTFSVAQARTDAVGVAGIASFTSLLVLAVLMTLDVHLTLRGAADLLFALLALATTAAGPGRPAMVASRTAPGNGRWSP
jgi:hypothetical protein